MRFFSYFSLFSSFKVSFLIPTCHNSHARRHYLANLVAQSRHVCSVLSDSKYVWKELWLLKTISLTVMQHAVSGRSSLGSFRRWPLTNTYIKVQPLVLQRRKLRDRHSVIQNVSNGPFNVSSAIVAFFMFSQTQITCHASDWQVAKQFSGACGEKTKVYEIYDNVSGLQ